MLNNAFIHHAKGLSGYDIESARINKPQRSGNSDCGISIHKEEPESSSIMLIHSGLTSLLIRQIDKNHDKKKNICK